MINTSDIHKIETELAPCTTVKKAVKYLSSYRENMQKIERSIFERFEAAAANSPRKDFQQLLNEWYPEAITKLKLEEFKIIDDIDILSENLSPETALAVRARTTECRSIIINDDPQHQFKRKTILDSINQITAKDANEAQILEKLKDRSNYLPASGTSENAFIVKYARRSHYEISKRLLMASTLTIEHIKPDSKGGKNELKNFLPVSANANSYRQNMPLSKYIEMFPQIPKNCQKFIERIIEIINNGGLKGFQTYPFNVKRTLKEESEGKIKLNLSGLRFNKREATKLEKEAKKQYPSQIGKAKQKKVGSK